MGIFIKKMWKPENCYVCPFLEDVETMENGRVRIRCFCQYDDDLDRKNPMSPNCALTNVPDELFKLFEGRV